MQTATTSRMATTTTTTTEEDPAISVMYRQEVLGKQVWIKFPVESSGVVGARRYQFFAGVITKMEAFYPNHDTTEPLEYQHFVYFGDHDDAYYNLTEQEDTGYLKWSDPDDNDNDEAEAGEGEDKVNGASIPRVVTPEKKRRASPADAASQQSQKKKKVKVKHEHFGTTISNISNSNNQELNGKEFEHWLSKIHKGKKGTNISTQNVRSTMNRARDLISGDGIRYKHWPPGVRFWEGKTLSLDTDFENMHEQAKAFEDRYGEDLGHGWLMKHPINKLRLYKQYIEAKRYERAHPAIIS